jgi:GNAT superfamily N-acetyltransferase
MAETPAPPDLTIQPLTAERWPDLEALFGPRGACGSCWCMWWRLKRSEFEQQKGEANRRTFQAIVDSGTIPGLLGYQGGQPVAWVAVAPRESYPVLERSRNLKRVDDAPVWSVTCLFVARPFRWRGFTVLMLKAAIGHARRNGARIVEGYPIEPQAGEVPAVFAWTGLASAFRQAGFHEVLRRAPTRPIMRYELPR